MQLLVLFFFATALSPTFCETGIKVSVPSASMGKEIPVSDGGFAIEWDEAIDLGRGSYARIHPLKDGRLMAAYSSGGGIVARFASPRNLREWGKPITVARDFVATNGVETCRVFLTNAEFAQLDSGRLIYACNMRPDRWRHDVHPSGIAIATSDDGGKSWSPLKTICAPRLAMAADGRPHGCYEPFVLPLKGGAAQIYFADETPYEKVRCAWQNISFVETSDGGETWGEAKIAAYTPERRDGMPVVMDLGLWRYLAIEVNPGKTRLHPQIVKCPLRGAWREAERFEPLAEPPDWNRVYGGAPYIAATENYILLSWQQSSLSGKSEATSLACVAAVPKSEVAADGKLRTRGVSTPPGMVVGKDSMLWNSLCPLDGDAFLLISQVKGRITVYPGRVSEK